MHYLAKKKNFVNSSEVIHIKNAVTLFFYSKSQDQICQQVKYSEKQGIKTKYRAIVLLFIDV